MLSYLLLRGARIVQKQKWKWKRDWWWWVDEENMRREKNRDTQLVMKSTKTTSECVKSIFGKVTSIIVNVPMTRIEQSLITESRLMWPIMTHASPSLWFNWHRHLTQKGWGWKTSLHQWPPKAQLRFSFILCNVYFQLKVLLFLYICHKHVILATQLPYAQKRE